MFRKLIVAIFLTCSVSYGQSTTGWSIVTTQGTNLYQDGSVLAAGITNYFAPSYAALHSSGTPLLTAGSVVVTNGTITSGTVTNTRTVDQVYLDVQETGVWELYYRFTNATACPFLLDFTGRYDGNPAHNVKFQMYDYIVGAYTNMTADADDLPSGSVDVSIELTVPGTQTNFCNASGESIVKIYQQTGSAVSSHHIFTDYIALIYADGVLTNAGTWYDITAVALGTSNNMDVSASDATITTTSAGENRIAWYSGFTGSDSTTFVIRHVTNSVEHPAGNFIRSYRTIGASSSIGSMSAFGYDRQQSGTTNAWQIMADTPNAWYAIFNGHKEVVKTSN